MMTRYMGEIVSSGERNGTAGGGGGTCPFCGAAESAPFDNDSWMCLKCGWEYPTFAYKCAHPGCWEFVFSDCFCDKHKPQAD